jgi:hypothetical protein
MAENFFLLAARLKDGSKRSLGLLSLRQIGVGKLVNLFSANGE